MWVSWARRRCGACQSGDQRGHRCEPPRARRPVGNCRQTAPAALAYACGLVGGWDAVVLVYFVCCGVSRLARYNVTAESMSEETGKVTYFEGTPIPTSVLLTAILAWCAWQRRIGPALPGGA